MSVVEKCQKYGSLTVLEFEAGFRKSGKPKTLALCLCDCGKTAKVEKYNLSRGNTTRCMSCKARLMRDKKRTHGHSYGGTSGSDLEKKSYYTWQAIKRRCLNRNSKDYKNYGGRGVTVSKEWENDYICFLEDMGLPPSMDHQIDRINNDGGYCKENCRWATRSQNGRNKRNSRTVIFGGRDISVAELAEITGMSYDRLLGRLNRWDDDVEKSINKGAGGKYSIEGKVYSSYKEVQDDYEVNFSSIRSRLDSIDFPRWIRID